MHEEVELYFKGLERSLPSSQTIEKNRGVVEVRTCYKASSDWFADKDNWMNLRAFYSIKLESCCGEVVKEQTRYFISSLETNPEEMLKIVRSHWSIENGLHKSLDVFF